jgi:ParB-like chromosome segregation protein Spo0J
VIIHEEIQNLAVEIDEVRPWHKNAREGDIGVLSESLRINGQYKPILVQASSKKIIAGNHTWRAARALKAEQIAVLFLDVTDNEAERIVLVDNRTSDLASYDFDILREQLESIPSLEGTGYTPEDIPALEELVDEPMDLTSPLTATLRFDSEEQQRRWNEFIRYLRSLYPDAATDAVRIDEHIHGILLDNA